MPQALFNPGDLFFCNLIIHNTTSNTWTDLPEFVILDVGGILFFAPSFDSFDHYAEDIPPGTTTIPVISAFEWPENCGVMSEVLIYAGITDPDYSSLMSNLAVISFGWSE